MKNTDTETIVLAGGCFWCIEAGFDMIKGVTRAVSGFAGDKAENASHYTVASGTTTHAEAVQVTFDPKQISLETILDIFWTLHNPTTLNQQGNDVGPQYRSAIFYANETQHKIAQESIKKITKLWDDPIVTELKPLEKFYPAEESHQKYYQKHPEFAYCQLVINPKLHKLQEKHAGYLK